MLRQRLSAILVAALLFASCRFRDLTPGSSRHDEAALQAAVTAFYQAMAAKDSRAMERVIVPSATALVTAAGASAILEPVRATLDAAERRNQVGGVRVVRTELHIDGDVATDRVVVVTRGRGGRDEYEAADAFTLARSDGGWRVAHVLFGPWRRRSAP